MRGGGGGEEGRDSEDAGEPERDDGDQRIGSLLVLMHNTS